MANKEQRVAVLVDVGNMYHSAKNLYSARVNFGKVLEIAVANRQLIRAIAYVVESHSSEEKWFFDALEKQGFEIKSKDLQIFPGGMKKGDWDVGLSVDAIRLCSRLDTIVLVTGDGDYEPLVEYLQNQGVQVEAVAFRESASARLLQRVDVFHDLSKNKRKFLMNKS